MPVKPGKLVPVCAVTMVLSCVTWGAGYQSITPTPPDLFALSLEELTRIDVTSAARKTQNLFKTPAAVFVANTDNVRSTWMLERCWALNSSGYTVSSLERTSPFGLPAAKQFVRPDTHLSFNFFEAVKPTAGGDNLLQRQHPEFDPHNGYTVRAQGHRSAFVKASWSF